MITGRTYRDMYLADKHHELYTRALDTFGEYDPRTDALKKTWLKYNTAVSLNTATLSDIEEANAWRTASKAFFVVDSEPDDWEAYKLNFSPADEEKAIEAAKGRYDHLSEHDAARRNDFYLCYAPELENGLPDLDRTVMITEII